MTPQLKRALIGLTLLACAFGIRLGAATWWQQRLGGPGAFAMPDTHSYWLLGQQLAAGEPYEYGGRDFQAFRAPGYPFVLAALFRVWGPDASMLSARILGAVLGTAAVAGVMWLSNSLFGSRAEGESKHNEGREWSNSVGWLAGGLAAIYPGAIAMSIFVLSEALFCPLMLLHLVCWVKATTAGTPRGCRAWSISGGVAAGLAILTRPSWLLFTPFVLASLVLTSPNRRRHLLVGGWMALALCAAMAPWWVRNYCVTGHFVVTTSQVGASLYDGLNPDATGASEMSFAESFYRQQKKADAKAGRSAKGFEVRLDRRLRNAALAWAANHPRRVTGLMGRKFMRIWNIWPNEESFRQGWLGTVVAAGYTPLLALSLVGAGIWGRRGWPPVICLFPAIYFTGLHLVFVGSIRYRQPAMLVWLILAAAVMVAAWWRIRGKALNV